MKGGLLPAATHFRIIAFRDGHRIDRRVPTEQLEQAKVAVRKLRAEGHKATIVRCLVNRFSKDLFPPDDEIEERRLHGYLWCPYCRTWRYFKVPRLHTYNGGFGSREAFLNSAHNQGVPICAWCEISVYDYHVGIVNGIFAEIRGSRRRRTRRKRRVPRRAG